MKFYRLEYVIRSPGPDEEPDKFIAEVPVLPGCRAWGDTPAEALEILQSVAAAYIESSRQHGDPLPPELAASGFEEAMEVRGEVLIAV